MSVPPPAVARRPAPPRGRVLSSGPSLLRSSKVMAAGTLASRGTGLLRTVVIAAVVGVGYRGDAYAIANTLPNIVYELLLGGVLTSVVVPLLVRAGKDSAEEGVVYAQRLLTLVALTLGIAAVVGVLIAPSLVDVYLNQKNPAERSLAIEFSRYFLPQIAFYGVGAMMGAILNTRGRFAAPMWVPVLNNIVVLATGFIVLLMPDALVHGRHELSHNQLVVLALGTTLGVVTQTVALVPPLRRSGFHWRPRFDFRHTGLAHVGRLGGWVLLYVLANQLGLAVVIRLADQTLSGVTGHGSGSYATYVNAFIIFSLPHAIITVSVITALLPRMSRHVVAGRADLLPREMSIGLRLSSVILVPATFALIVLAQPIVQVLLRHGAVSDSDARVLGWTLATFAVGLIPFSAFQLHLRAFYALGDTRTPAYISVILNSVNVLADLLLFVSLHGSARLPGLAAGYALSYVVGVSLTGAVLRRRLGRLGAPRIIRTLVRVAIASAIGAMLAWGAATLVERFAGHGFTGSLLALAVAVPLGAVVALRIAQRLHVREVTELLSAFGAKGGRPPTRHPAPRRA